MFVTCATYHTISLNVRDNRFTLKSTEIDNPPKLRAVYLRTADEHTVFLFISALVDFKFLCFAIVYNLLLKESEYV